tara:strand:+ start:2992 stop:4182 length:1191 start_codon:yes stop_codon:yes gene_type:complete
MEENKEVVEETTQPKEEGKLKIKMPKIVKDDGPIKLDLSKKEEPVEQVKENETTNDSADETRVLEDVKPEDTGTAQEQKEVQPEAEAQEAPVLEEITEQKVEEKVEELVEETKDAIAEAKETGKPLPENIQKLIDFMDKTGGDLTDYVKLNQDYSKLDDNLVLKEYYKQTKGHLNNEEIDFLIEDRFSYDEEEATDREIKRKKLAFKEQVADARRHMDGLKSSYYEEIKAGSKLTSDQKEAINFYNEYNKNSEQNKKVQLQQKSIFDKKTEGLFNNDFKGFEYNVGDKTYRFNVNNASEVKQTQSDINNFVKKFLNEKNEMSDAKGYHKSLFTAMNSDAIAQHFYEQGKADAIKESVSKAKNVDMSPRQSYGDEKTGFKYKVLGDNSSSFKLKLKK